MIGDLWLPLIIGGISVLIAIGQLFVDQGKVGVRTLAVQVDKESLGIKLATMNADRLAQLEAANIGISSKFAAIVQEYANVIQDSTKTKTELEVTKLKLITSDQEVVLLNSKVDAMQKENIDLRTKVDALQKENAELRSKLETMQKQLDAQKA